jgi:hypothetical protein
MHYEFNLVSIRLRSRVSACTVVLAAFSLSLGERTEWWAICTLRKGYSVADEQSVSRVEDSRKKPAFWFIHMSSWRARIKKAHQAARGYRLSVVLLTIVLGVALIIIAGNPGWFGLKSWPLAQSVLVNFGTAFVLAAVLVLLQPAFKRTVQKAVNTAVRPVTGKVTDLQERVDTLTERTNNLLRARDERVDQNIMALDDSPSFETITAALQDANDMKAFVDGIATVQGGKDPSDDRDVDLGNPLSVRVRFLWGSHPGAPDASLLVQVVCDQGQYLNAHPEFYGSPLDNNDQKVYEIVWQPGNPPEDVGAEIRQGLVSEGLYRGGDAFEWGKTIIELKRTISVAVASRRGGEWPTAPLFEVVGDDWAITREGVEYRYSREFGPVFMEEDFPSIYPGGPNYNVPDFTFRWPPQSPSGVPQPSDRVLTRAAAYLPLRNFPPNTPTGWKPIRTA